MAWQWPTAEDNVATITFRPRFSRRLPDPFYNSTHGTERHVLFVAVSKLPTGVSMAASLKTLETRWEAYKDVQASLINKDCTPGTFHLKNQGITIIARAVNKIEDDEFEIEFGEGHGVVDGSHTYRLIIEAQQNPNIQLPAEQYVKVEILTKVPDDWIAEITGALNTPIVGQKDSLADLQDAFAWIKKTLKGEPYYRYISWSESQRGIYGVQDILSILTCFNTSSYTNAGSAHPIVAYENRSVVLSSFEEDYKTNRGRSYKKLRPILKDILTLHDTIQLEFPKYLERAGEGDSVLIEQAIKKPHKFPFLQTRSTERLANGALLPVLAAFRWMVEDDPSSGYSRWKGGFESVLERWRDAGERLVTQTIEKGREVDNNPDAIGRSPAHWGALHKEVAFVDLMGKQEPRPAAAEETSETAPEPAAVRSSQQRR